MENIEQIKENVHTKGLELYEVLADLMRIWKSVFLKANNSEKVSKMIMNHNISTFPKWTKIDTNKLNNFTLIFEALPKDCTSFDLVEDALEDGGFLYKNIQRTYNDVYEIIL